MDYIIISNGVSPVFIGVDKILKWEYSTHEVIIMRFELMQMPQKDFELVDEEGLKEPSVNCSSFDDILHILGINLGANDDNFTMEILKDLVKQGYKGEEFLEKFMEQQQQIRMAIRSLIEESDEIAKGKRTSVTTEELFGEA